MQIDVVHSQSIISDSSDIQDFKKPAVLVISGGGARGAWGAGISKALDRENQFKYRHIIGTSTGSLMAPLIAIENYELLELMYTTSKRKNILKKKLYKAKKGKFRIGRVLGAVICGRTSVTSSKPLKKTINRSFSEEDYQRLQESDCEVEVTVHNLDLGGTAYRSSKDYDRKNMIDWIWASANQPVFMTPVNKRDTFILYSSNPDLKVKESKQHTQEIEDKRREIQEGVFEYHFVSDSLKWVDGGASENIPLSRGLEVAVDSAIDDIIVIVNNKPPKQIYLTPAIQDPNDTTEVQRILDEFIQGTGKYERVASKTELNALEMYLMLASQSASASFHTDALNRKGIFKSRNLIEVLLATIDGFSKEILLNDITNAIQSKNAIGKTFHFFFMPLEVYEKNPLSLLFNTTKMREQFDAGAQFSFKDSSNKKYAQYFRFKVDQQLATLMESKLKDSLEPNYLMEQMQHIDRIKK